MKPETLKLPDALTLLSFPRTLGNQPQTGEPVTVQDGRFGPYVKMGNQTRSLADHQQLMTITLDAALALLAQPKSARRAAGARAAAQEVGKHPASGATIVLKQGRFGPYVTDGTVNASLPKGMPPTDLTLDKAVELLAAREQYIRDRGEDPGSQTPAADLPPHPGCKKHAGRKEQAGRKEAEPAGNREEHVGFRVGLQRPSRPPPLLKAACSGRPPCRPFFYTNQRPAPRPAATSVYRRRVQSLRTSRLPRAAAL